MSVMSVLVQLGSPSARIFAVIVWSQPCTSVVRVRFGRKISGVVGGSVAQIIFRPLFISSERICTRAISCSRISPCEALALELRYIAPLLTKARSRRAITASTNELPRCCLMDKHFFTICACGKCDWKNPAVDTTGACAVLGCQSRSIKACTGHCDIVISTGVYADVI